MLLYLRNKLSSESHGIGVWRQQHHSKRILAENTNLTFALQSLPKNQVRRAQFCPCPCSAWCTTRGHCKFLKISSMSNSNNLQKHFSSWLFMVSQLSPTHKGLVNELARLGFPGSFDYCHEMCYFRFGNTHVVIICCPFFYILLNLAWPCPLPLSNLNETTIPH